MSPERPQEPHQVLITFPEGPRLVDASKSQVLYNLVSIHGGCVGPDIASSAFVNPNLKRLIVMGQPGANKSTVLGQWLNQTAMLDAQYYGNQVYLDDVLYDEELKKFAKEVGLPRDQWPPEYWVRVSGRIYDSINKEPPKEELKGRRDVKGIEIVGISVTGGRDRAVSSLRKIAEDMKRQPESQQETQIVAIVADPRSQARSGKIRQVGLETPDAEVYDRLIKEFLVEVIGIPNPQTSEGGATIKAIMREQAETHVIEKAQADIREEVRNWAKRIGDEELQKRKETIVVPPEVAGMTGAQMEEYILMAAHLDDLLHNQLGLTEKQAMAVFSPYTPNKRILWPLWTLGN